MPPTLRLRGSGCCCSSPVPYSPSFNVGEATITRPLRRVRASDHRAIPLLMALNERLEDALRSGAIKLIVADRVRDGTIHTKIVRRQDLEARERAEHLVLFATADDAIALLTGNGREIASLTYGWVSTDDPDPSGEYLRAVCRFLKSELGAHVRAIFWDFASLPQKPYSKCDAKMVATALKVMPDVYASILGTMVMRHRSMPARPASLDGEVVVLADDKATEAAVRSVLEAHGTLENVRRDEQGRWRARFASHADAERAVAAGPFVDVTAICNGHLGVTAICNGHLGVTAIGNGHLGVTAICNGHLGVTAIFTCHHARPYAARGWPKFESGVCTEGIIRAARCPGLKATLERLPPKLIEIDGEVPTVARDPYGSAHEGASARVQRVRSSLHEAFFTSKGDRALVVRLYNEHIAKLGHVMVRWCEAVEGEYVGERNAAGEMEGHGTKRYADGSVYEGEWKANHKAGRGMMRGADGNVYEGEYKDGQREGRGIYQYPSGAVYDGQWKAGKMDGHGTYHFANGNVYEGEYRADKKEGRGAFKYADGDIEVSS